ncbi:hypothetical protein [Kitasatospora indigofera]
MSSSASSARWSADMCSRSSSWTALDLPALRAAAPRAIERHAD